MNSAFAMPVLVLTLAAALYMAWNVGANDVANAMGTSVGSGALTFRQAVIVAAIFEFAGAALFGGTVSDTIRKGIVDPTTFAGKPDLFVLGMLAALLAAAIWLNIATRYGLPVSTTHAIVSAVTGFGIMEFGPDAVDWGKMMQIVASWFISPVAGGILGFSMFLLIRRLILDRPDPFQAALDRIPYLLWIVLTTLFVEFVYHGGKHFLKRFEVTPPPLGLSIFAAAILAAMVAAFMTGFIRRRARRDVEGSPFVRVENIFIALQILTACYVALAHGANDVANAVGPLAAVFYVIRTGEIDMSVPVPLWVLGLGGVGIVIGLATYGYNVMMTVGKEIIEMTPTRGFSAEFGAATTVLVCSLIGLPISTTHTLVGAVVGVGFARGMGALNRRVIYRIAASWLITVPVSALICVVLYTILKVIF